MRMMIIIIRTKTTENKTKHVRYRAFSLAFTAAILVVVPFTRANHSVHGVGKWFAKFSTGKFRPGITFTICSSQFH